MKRGRILILLGIILGLATTVAAFLLLRGMQPQQPARPTEVPTQKVLVAVQNIGQAQPIDPATVELREFEKTQIPTGALLNATELAGKLAAVDIVQGQIIRREMLTDKAAIVDQGLYASFLVPPGKVAVAFPIDELSSVAYGLQSGDTVDVLVTVKLVSVDPTLQIKEPVMRTAPSGAAAGETQILGSQVPRMVTQLTLQNVTILKIGQWSQPQRPQPTGTPGAPKPASEPQLAQPAGQQGEAVPTPPAPTIMTVLVDQQDALVLKFAREAGASIQFALRGRNDRDVVTTEPVTLDYMIRRFNITPPDRLPWAVEMEGGVAAATPAPKQ